METWIAQQIAAAVDLPFEAWTIEPYLLADLDRAAVVIEGAEDLTQTRQLGVIDRIGAHADHVLAAHWGDVWLDDMGVAPTDRPDQVRDHVIAKFAKNGGAWLLEARLQPASDHPAAAVKALLEEEFEPYRGNRAARRGGAGVQDRHVVVPMDRTEPARLSRRRHPEASVLRRPRGGPVADGAGFTGGRPGAPGRAPCPAGARPGGDPLAAVGHEPLPPVGEHLDAPRPLCAGRTPPIAVAAHRRPRTDPQLGGPVRRRGRPA